MDTTLKRKEYRPPCGHSKKIITHGGSTRKKS